VAPVANKSFATGTIRAACPIPQLSGLNKMRFALIFFKIWFHKLKTL
jgi:hypothetical protein